MLPIGTTWIRDVEHGVFSRVCRKQNIDAAKAVVGFDGKKGYPVTNGYVICKEFEVSSILGFLSWVESLLSEFIVFCEV